MRGLALALAGCASGGAAVDSGASGGRDATGQQDGTITIDAPSTQTRTLSQTTSQTIKPLASLACRQSGGTRANNYYRVFDLAAFGITTDFKVTQVSFQVEHCNQFSGSNGAVVAVRVGTYSAVPGDMLANANMTILASNATVQVPEVIENPLVPSTPGGTVNAPITAMIPAGERLLVEVDAPDGLNVYEFFMGANDGGEAGFGYLLAPTCGINTPTNISSIAPASQRNLLLTVTGTY